MTAPSPVEWNAAQVDTWLESRIAASRLNQAEAQRGGRRQEDDCDLASAEEMVCSAVRRAAGTQSAFTDSLRLLLDRDVYLWRGVYDDARFDRHVRAYVRKLLKMAKTGTGFDKTGRYQ